MAVTLNNLYEQSKGKYRLRLGAGEAGMNHTVTWAQFTEDILTTDFLKGSELIFTTGLNSYGDKWIVDFVGQLLEAGAAGIIVNVGKYILEEDITEEIIQLCDSQEFPLIIMPWEIHLSDIMQDYCNQILLDSKYQDRITTALKNLIFHTNMQDASIEELTSCGFQINESYSVAVIDETSTERIKNKFHLIMDQISNVLNYIKMGYHIFYQENLLIVLFHNVVADKLKSVLTELSRSHLVHFIGVSDVASGIYDISLLYKQALAALKEAQHNQLKSLYFNEMDINRLFFFVENKDILNQIYQENLGVLEKYDNQHGGCLLNTFKAYILWDGSIQKVAQQMYTHRNTINYRVKKIKELLGDNVDTMQSKFKYQLAFNIRDYMDLE